jgi:hypothetical protein
MFADVPVGTLLELFNGEALMRPRYADVIYLFAMGPLMIRFVKELVPL